MEKRDENSTVSVSRKGVRNQQESVSAFGRNYCPESARISVRFTQESLSGLTRNQCPDWARICKYENIFKYIPTGNGYARHKTIYETDEFFKQRRFEKVYNDYFKERRSQNLQRFYKFIKILGIIVGIVVGIYTIIKGFDICLFNCN